MKKNILSKNKRLKINISKQIISLMTTHKIKSVRRLCELIGTDNLESDAKKINRELNLNHNSLDVLILLKISLKFNVTIDWLMTGNNTPIFTAEDTQLLYFIDTIQKNLDDLKGYLGL